MKRYFILLLLMLMALCAEAQKVIQMEKDGGVYKISCKVKYNNKYGYLFSSY
jgi:hypothetical protein